MHCIIVRNQISGYLYSLRSSGNTHTQTHTHTQYDYYDSLYSCLSYN